MVGIITGVVAGLLSVAIAIAVPVCGVVVTWAGISLAAGRNTEKAKDLGGKALAGGIVALAAGSVIVPEFLGWAGVG